MARLLSRKEPLRASRTADRRRAETTPPRTSAPPCARPAPTCPDRCRTAVGPGFPACTPPSMPRPGLEAFPRRRLERPPLNRKRHRSRRTTPGLRPRPGFVRSLPPNSAPGPRPGSPRLGSPRLGSPRTRPGLAPDSPPSFFRRLFPKLFCGPSAPPLPKNAPRQSFPPSFRKSTGRFPPPFSLPRSPGSP